MPGGECGLRICVSVNSWDIVLVKLAHNVMRIGCYFIRTYVTKFSRPKMRIAFKWVSEIFATQIKSLGPILRAVASEIEQTSASVDIH